MYRSGKLPAGRAAVPDAWAEYFVDIPACLQSVVNRVAGNAKVLSPLTETHSLAMSRITSVRLVSVGGLHFFTAALLITQGAAGNKV